MSEKKSLGTRKTPARAPAGILSLDGTVALRQKQARRPPAVAGSDYRPVILLAENRESTRVALKNVLEATGYDVIVVEGASEALSIGAGYNGHIDFLITEVALPGINGGPARPSLSMRTPGDTSPIPLRKSRRGIDLPRHIGSEDRCSRATRSFGRLRQQGQ